MSTPVNYDALEHAGYETHLFCRCCNAILDTPSTVVMGVCTNCVASSYYAPTSMPRPRYRNGHGKRK